MRPDLPSAIAEIEKRLSVSTARTRLVAVDGPSGSGKSTFASLLAARLKAPLVPIDDFVTWEHFGAWWPRFEEQVLGPLLEGRDAVYQARDWEGDEFGDALGEWRTVPWNPVIVLEGVTCSRRAIADELACSVWIEASPGQRLARGIERDGESHRALWERWMVEEEAFFAADRTRERATLHIDGSA
ncbi:uridine kinase family protein [Leifsonia poae]|uniref:uridine kinase family protein n=1 Tax=Leifsonia poae TaxID=110933 RepID=UPI003D6650EE